VPVRLVDLTHLPDARRHFGAALLLVRPDQHVAWRGGDGDDAERVLARITGAELSSCSPIG
jgi:hypothetical protein